MSGNVSTKRIYAQNHHVILLKARFRLRQKLFFASYDHHRYHPRHKFHFTELSSFKTVHDLFVAVETKLGA